MRGWSPLPRDVKARVLEFAVCQLSSPDLKAVETVCGEWLEWAEQYVRGFIYLRPPHRHSSCWLHLQRRGYLSVTRANQLVLQRSAGILP